MKEKELARMDTTGDSTDSRTASAVAPIPGPFRDVGGNAFPTHFGDLCGMSLRDYFAAKAIQSTLSASAANDGCYDYVAAAIGAYMVADAMLEERAK